MGGQPRDHHPLLTMELPVRPEHDRAQSCAIALRSPASERPSDLFCILGTRRPRSREGADILNLSCTIVDGLVTHSTGFLGRHASHVPCPYCSSCARLLPAVFTLYF